MLGEKTMKYTNPVIPGFYPDPSICSDGKKYYMVCSSFQFFPGVPLFESEDLINWNQIGFVLTRESQLPLKRAEHSAGIFAPTIRYNEGRFYMVTTNTTVGGNFYVYTDDIYGDWSEPIQVEQGGIDPSLYFEDGKAYFMSNGEDEKGEAGITQCEIDIATGKKLTDSRCIWKGTGGRYLESPHLYRINGTYYLMAAEGGTEYGHMVVYAKGETPFGPFTNYEKNPVLTNRNLGGYEIQGCGHADLIQDKNKNWWMVHLAFRQIGRWETFHITGREVYLVPVQFDEEGWFTAGNNGTTTKEVETDRLPEVAQQYKEYYDFENCRNNWYYIRNPQMDNYEFAQNQLILHGGNISIQDPYDSPTFVGIPQTQMAGSVRCQLTVDKVDAGMALLKDENHHYDFFLREQEGSYQVVKRLCIGDIQYEQQVQPLKEGEDRVTLRIDFGHFEYGFTVEGQSVSFGTAKTRYLSTEVAGGFTGVLVGLYANTEGNRAVFTEFQARMYQA